MQPKFVSGEEVREELKARIRYDYTQSKLADELKMSYGMLSQMLSGQKPVGNKALIALGYDPTPYYRRADVKTK